MRIVRDDFSAVEDEDVTRFHFAKAALLLREVVDQASLAYCEGRPFTEVELRKIHDDLSYVFHIVRSETINSIAPTNDVYADDDLDFYRSWYSDRTPVVVARFDELADPVRQVPAHFRATGITPHVAEAYEWLNPTSAPLASEQEVWEPPHMREAANKGHGSAVSA